MNNPSNYPYPEKKNRIFKIDDLSMWSCEQESDSWTEIPWESLSDIQLPNLRIYKNSIVVDIEKTKRFRRLIDLKPNHRGQIYIDREDKSSGFVLNGEFRRCIKIDTLMTRYFGPHKSNEDPDEQWRCLDFLNCDNYWISSKGRLIGPLGLMEGSPCPRGYLRVGLILNSKSPEGKFQKWDIRIHSLVAKAFLENDNPEYKIEIDHKDGNKFNNYVDNLEWVTPQENDRRARVLGLKHRGNYEKAIRVCEMINDSFSDYDIAIKLDVSLDIVKRIRKGESYTYLSKNYDFGKDFILKDALMRNMDVQTPDL